MENPNDETPDKNVESGNGKFELLSQEEKYKEIQKQDWQIEALIIGSIIIGLVQVPNLVLSYEYYFKSIFGIFYIFFESLTNIPFLLLLLNLIFVLYHRIIWVINVNAQKIDESSKHEKTANQALSNGLEIFILTFFGLLFYTTPIVFFDFILKVSEISNSGYLYYKHANLILAGFLAMFYIIGLSSFFFKDQIILKKFIFPIYTFFPIKKKGYCMSEFGGILHFIIAMLCFSTAVLKNVESFNPVFIVYSNYSLNNEIKNGCIAVIEDEKIENETLWLFLESDQIPQKRIEIEYMHSIGKTIRYTKKICDTSQVEIKINDNLVQLDWREYKLNNINGVKSYLKKDMFKSGYNVINIRYKTKTNVFLTDSYQIEVYKP